MNVENGSEFNSPEEEAASQAFNNRAKTKSSEPVNADGDSESRDGGEPGFKPDFSATFNISLLERFSPSLAREERREDIGEAYQDLVEDIGVELGDNEWHTAEEIYKVIGEHYDNVPPIEKVIPVFDTMVKSVDLSFEKSTDGKYRTI